MNQSILRNLAFYALMFFVVWTVADYMSGSHQAPQATALGYSDFNAKVQSGEVDKVVIVQNNIRGTLTDGTEFTTIAPDAPNSDQDLYKRLSDKGINISAENPPEPPWWQTMLTSLIPIAILIGFWFFIMQQSQMGGGRMMNFGKSRVRLMVSDKKKVTFADVAGADEAKQELEEVVEFLKTPEKFNDLGARIPKGVLLFGPPGTGKTLLAKAVAGEAGVQFFTISGSDFVEMFVGVGASRVRDLFEQAKKAAPCIVFIDEIDAVGRQRGAGLGGGHDEREQTLNQLLVEMDGFASNEGIIIIAATNRPDVLDPALLRPGRFDRQIVVDKPDVRGREAILKVHTKGKPIADDVNLDVLARRTPGFTGADLSNLVNEAALLAARRDKKKIYMAEMEEAIERVLAGPERKSHVMTDEEKRLTAYHEGGHTLVGLLLEHADPVHKVTIIPRGRAGGYMLSLPKEDRSYRTRSELFDRIKVALGGRVAEEVVLGEISTGASSDIQQATQIIRSMIMQYGMSDTIGPIAYGEENHQVFLGRDFNRDRNYSEEVAGEIDREVRRYIEEAYEACRVIITENREKLDLIANALLERETLNASELEELMTKGEISDKSKDDDDTDDTGKPAMIPVDVVIDDSTQTSEEAERAAEERPAPVPSTEPKFNVTQWNK
ncbi:ATP-dependent metallopeptidase FtsH/Yme1/Tma family protein [Selenomonas timonae]|uniref:ATP-dependent zinc metalloprotease FtsH n=1 Tax=Selenomonas timonae TaxID=2754044 RepID=A0A7G7VJJ6_9FIRM|nr:MULTISPECIES: ATP-dependent zinc metalloprotease FtsH [Selenomonas]EJO22554.1 ATP-dependent metallopeptidase HflB [Selenomonas sp. FOBRC6]QNH54289.1 ATP-dependent metallopeptidase FtsH/Yme1/Tma family protein [Selenomonas timonae]